MIEYLATAGAVGFAFGVVLWRERRHPSLFVAALASRSRRDARQADDGRVLDLARPRVPSPRADPSGDGGDGSTRGSSRSSRCRSSQRPLWTRHADAIKAASPVTEWLTSSSLRRWNFGWTGQRIDPSAWYSILQHTVPSLLSLYAVLLVPAAIAAWRSTQRLFWLAVASAVVLPPLVFMNLYVNHDYYPAAISPAIAALLGLGCGWVWSVVRPRWLVAALRASRAAGVGHAGARTRLLAANPRRLRRSSGDAARERDRGTHPEHRSGGTVGLDWSRPSSTTRTGVGTWSPRTPAMPVSPRSTTTATGTCSSPSRFARIWDSWRGGGGSALSGRTCTGSPMSEHASRPLICSPRTGAEVGRPARPRVVRRRCAGGAEVLGRDTHSRGTVGDVAALRGGRPGARVSVDGLAPVPRGAPSSPRRHSPGTARSSSRARGARSSAWSACWTLLPR